MDRHASPAALPELQAFLARCQVRLRRPEGGETLERSTTGLFTEWLTNICDPMAQAVLGTRAARVQDVLTTRQGTRGTSSGGAGRRASQGHRGRGGLDPSQRGKFIASV
jgi:hypothetical protein